MNTLINTSVCSLSQKRNAETYMFGEINEGAKEKGNYYINKYINNYTNKQINLKIN